MHYMHGHPSLTSTAGLQDPGVLLAHLMTCILLSLVFKQFKRKCLAVVSDHQPDSAIPEGEKDGSFLFGDFMILRKHWSAVFMIG